MTLHETLLPWVGLRCRIRSEVRGRLEWDYWTVLARMTEIDPDTVVCSDGTVWWRVLRKGFEVELEPVVGSWDFRRLSEIYRVIGGIS